MKVRVTKKSFGERGSERNRRRGKQYFRDAIFPFGKLIFRYLIVDRDRYKMRGIGKSNTGHVTPQSGTGDGVTVTVQSQLKLTDQQLSTVGLLGKFF